MPSVVNTVNYVNNPYKFSVYRAGAYNTAVATTTRVPFDTKTYDTGSNVDIVTNVGRFTAPVAGFYQFNGSVLLGSSTSRIFLSIYKNGVEYRRGTDFQTATVSYSATVAGSLQLSAGDYVEMWCWTDAARAVATTTSTSFDGFLISQT